MPGVDILRGLAVIAVVCYHGLDWALPRHTKLSSGARLLGVVVHSGWIGVNLFFVLSGFLITGILLDSRSRRNYWKSFYVRRVLRIFPLYLVVLALAFFAVRLHPGYMLLCILYAANLTQYFGVSGPIYSVLWSLAVEEQFYLVWPLLIRRISAYAMTFVCIALVLLCPILRALSVWKYSWLGDPYSTTWLVSDNLAWGALIALFLRSTRASTKNLRILVVSLALSSTLLFGALAGSHLLSRKVPLGAAFQVVPFLAMFTVLLLLALRFGNNPHLLRWSAPIRFFGYISYGLYLLHILFFSYYDHLLIRYITPPDLLTAPAVLFRFFNVMVICSFACFLSRRFFEERFLRLKDRLVPYERRPSAAQ